MKRSYNRSTQEIRPVVITDNIMGNAASSALLSLGNTKVICAVTLSDSVPKFLRGKGDGWLTAEYSMLPAATGSRTKRESTQGKCSGRTVEISRLIGRSLRTIVNLKSFGEKTIQIDCDVIQADGGTRTAALTGACYVLRQAEQLWLEQGVIASPFLSDELAAISVGVKDGAVLLDIDYVEDSQIDADFNFVMTRSGKIIEIQGTAEQVPLAQHEFEQMRLTAGDGVQQLFIAIDQHVAPSAIDIAERSMQI